MRAQEVKPPPTPPKEGSIKHKRMRIFSFIFLWFDEVIICFIFIYFRFFTDQLQSETPSLRECRGGLETFMGGLHHLFYHLSAVAQPRYLMLSAELSLSFQPVVELPLTRFDNL